MARTGMIQAGERFTHTFDDGITKRGYIGCETCRTPVSSWRWDDALLSYFKCKRCFRLREQVFIEEKREPQAHYNLSADEWMDLLSTD